MGNTTLQDQTTHETPAAADDQCCEPDCGPDTCAPTQAVPLVDKPPTAATGCCEPDCGPDTCD